MGYAIRFDHIRVRLEVPYIQIFMSLCLGNGTLKEFKAYVAWTENSRKDTEDILTDPP